MVNTKSATKELSRKTRIKQVKQIRHFAKSPTRSLKTEGHLVLMLCQKLHDHKIGRGDSKEQSAKWVGQRFPQWAYLVRQSLLWDKEQEGDDDEINPKTLAAKIRRLASFVENFISAGENIDFRDLKQKDLTLLLKWHNQPHVKQWYDKHENLSTYDRIRAKYEPIINKSDKTQGYAILIGRKAVGLLQSYMIADYQEEYGQYLGLTDRAAGLDIFIGDPHYVHQGFGPTIIKKFVRESFDKNLAIDSFIIGPEPKNKAAIRAYEKAGFKHLKTIRLPTEREREYLMRLGREEL